MSHGLLVIAHDFPNARKVIGTYGFFGDLTRSKALKMLIELIINTPMSIQEKKEMRKYVYDRFGWDNLIDTYKEVFET